MLGAQGVMSSGDAAGTGCLLANGAKEKNGWYYDLLFLEQDSYQ